MESCNQSIHIHHIHIHQSECLSFVIPVWKVSLSITSELHNHSVQLLIIVLFGSFLIYKLRLSMAPDPFDEQRIWNIRVSEGCELTPISPVIKVSLEKFLTYRHGEYKGWYIQMVFSVFLPSDSFRATSQSWKARCVVVWDASPWFPLGQLRLTKPQLNYQDLMTLAYTY